MKTSLWRGLSAVMAFLLLLSIFGGQIANNNAGGINNFLGISASQVSSSGGRFASSYGELSDESLARLIADEDAFCIEQLEEGAVLLKNNGVLPLDASVKKVSLFGHASANIRYRNANGGGQADPAREINLKKAFTDAGFEVNDTLFDAYATSQVTYVKSASMLMQRSLCCTAPAARAPTCPRRTPKVFPLWRCSPMNGICWR